MILKIKKKPKNHNLQIVQYRNAKEYSTESLPTENLLGVTLKYKIDRLIDKLHNTLSESTINRSDLSAKTIETIKTLKTIEDCANCKGKEVRRNSFVKLCKSINKIGKKRQFS